MVKKNKMEELREKIKEIIESEYKKALSSGMWDGASATMRVWNYLLEEDAINIPAPEAVSGCYENLEE
ncbi:MAG: hypothetical protein Kow0098_22170 [Ignavibacteriaceae bacterium]